MKLPDVYGKGRFGLSFELFPPKTPAGDEALIGHVAQLAEFQPSFFTCTYGAGGSTRDKTLQIVSQVKQQFRVPVAAHLTCVGATREQLRDVLTQAAEQRVDYIVALRGDPPKGEAEFQQTVGGLRYANELVAMIREEFPQFGIAVAGYPETHQEAVSPEIDLDNLKRKVAAGADAVITQLFYENDDFFRFRQRYEAAGIDKPLIPGILPVTNLSQIQRITSLCGAKLPPSFVEKLAERDDPEWQFQVGVEFATEQVRGLLESGLPGLHFYVLNKSKATSTVLESLQLRGQGVA